MGSALRRLQRTMERKNTFHWTAPRRPPAPPERDPPMTVAEQIEGLRLAVSFLERGWLQGVYARDDEGHESLGWLPDCEVAWDALGACRAAVGPNRWSELQALVTETLGVPSLHQWNDAPERTQAEVIGAFMKTIERLEAA